MSDAEFIRYSMPDPYCWLTYTRLSSGYFVSTIMLDHHDPDLAGDFGSSVRDPGGTWSEVERYSNVDDAQEGHLKLVAMLDAEHR